MTAAAHTRPSRAPDRVLLASALRPQRRDVLVGAGLGVVHQLCEALVAVLIGIIVDEAITPGDPGRMAAWTGALVGVFVVLALAGLVGYYLQNRAAAGISHDLRVRIARRVVHPGGGTDAVRPGEVLSLAASDAMRVGTVAGVLGGALSAVVVLAGGAVYLLATSWRLGTVVLLGLPVLVWLSQRVAGPLERRSGDEQAAVARASGLATDLVAGLRVLKGIGAEAAGAARYRAVSTAARDGRIHAARWSGLADGVSLGLSGVFVVVVAWIGGRLALAGTITVGELVAAVGLAGFLVFPLIRLSGLPADVAVARASAARLAEFLDAPEGVTDGAARQAPAGDLVLDGVTLGPLRDVTFRVGATECLGVVAPDGADATALLDLLARRSDPATGAVRLGGTALPELGLAALRAAVLVGDHDAVLFEGTVTDNLGVGRDPAHRDRAVAAAAVGEVLSALAGGADTPVGERGRHLSGGQRQRVALARALAADPPVLVLHDPTTAVDAATEHRIARALRDVRAGRATVLVTTSPALLAVCDRVVVLSSGRITAAGTHRELTADPDYRAAVLS